MANVESAEDASAYLSSLSGDAAERITAMKWARYLGAAFGPSGALSALRYYAEIGWIGDDVRRTMVDYVRGLTIEELELSEVEPDLHGSLENLEGTEFERHARSLQFVAAISGRSIEHGLASLQLAETVGQRGLTGISGIGAGAAGQPPSMGPGGGPFVGNAGMEPGEQAQRAARRREADRQRRDERAGATPDPEAEAAGDADAESGPDPHAEAESAAEADADRPSDDTSEQIAERDHDETAGDESTTPHESAGADREDVAVSMADVTPGSSGDFDDVDGSGEGADEGEAAGDADQSDDDIAVGDETVPSRDPEPEPSPAPSPSESAALDDLDATFDDGDVAPEAETAASEASSDEVTNPDGDAPGNHFDETQAASDDDRPDADDAEGADPDGDHTAPPDEERCIALTRDGDRCSLPASDGEYCHRHAPDDD